MKNIEPVKRNKNLIVLSHEHHHGLLFAVRLKSAKKTNAKIIQVYVDDFWKKHLSDHFINEENLLQNLLKDKNILNQFLSEHEEIRNLVSQISETEKDYIVNSAKLGNAINDHIRFEERIMFPYLENHLSDEELKTIEKKLDKVEVHKHQFKPEFWLR